MASGGLSQPGSFGRCLDPLLGNRFVQVMASTYARPRINAELGSRKHPLPAPFSVGIRILSLQRIRERHFAKARFDILAMYLTDVFQMGNERLLIKNKKIEIFQRLEEVSMYVDSAFGRPSRSSCPEPHQGRVLSGRVQPLHHFLGAQGVPYRKGSW